MRCPLWACLTGPAHSHYYPDFPNLVPNCCDPLVSCMLEILPLIAGTPMDNLWVNPTCLEWDASAYPLCVHMKTGWDSSQRQSTILDWTAIRTCKCIQYLVTSKVKVQLSIVACKLGWAQCVHCISIHFTNLWCSCGAGSKSSSQGWCQLIPKQHDNLYNNGFICKMEDITQNIWSERTLLKHVKKYSNESLTFSGQGWLKYKHGKIQCTQRKNV